MKVLSTTKHDGFGARYIACICCFVKARNEGNIYKHIPFSDIQHNYNKDNKYSEKLNDFTGLKSDKFVEGEYEEIHHKWQYPLIINEKLPLYLNEIRQMYYSSYKPTPLQCDVAIHIRRGDVSSTINSQRFIQIDYYKNIIDKIMKLKGVNINIIVFSQGKEDDFKEISHYNNVTFKLNSDIMEAFHTMVCAPTFVMGYSALSCCAAILSANEVYYTTTETWKRQCIPMLKGWINADNI